MHLLKREEDSFFFKTYRIFIQTGIYRNFKCSDKAIPKMVQIIVKREHSDQFSLCSPVYFSGLPTKKKEEMSPTVSLRRGCVLEKT